jgi:hypothetical protein
LRRKEDIPDQHRRERRRYQSAAQAANPGTEKDGRIKEKPDEWLDRLLEKPLQPTGSQRNQGDQEKSPPVASLAV